MLVNVDGYISEVPKGTATLEFYAGGSDGRSNTAGGVIARDLAGNKLDMKCIAAEFNLPQKPWWDRVAEMEALA